VTTEDIGDLTCEKCKTNLARKIIAESNKELEKELKAERGKNKKEEEKLIQLSEKDTIVAITSVPESRTKKSQNKDGLPKEHSKKLNDKGRSVEENLKIAEVPKVAVMPKATETAENSEISQAIEALKTVEKFQAFETPKIPEAVKSIETFQSVETSKVTETVKNRETFQSVEDSKVAETVKNAEIAQVIESLKVPEKIPAVEVHKIAENVESSQAVEISKAVEESIITPLPIEFDDIPIPDFIMYNPNENLPEFVPLPDDLSEFILPDGSKSVAFEPFKSVLGMDETLAQFAIKPPVKESTISAPKSISSILGKGLSEFAVENPNTEFGEPAEIETEIQSSPLILEIPDIKILATQQDEIFEFTLEDESDLPELKSSFAEKVAEPVIEKVAEPVIEKVAEPVIEKVAEPVIEEVAEPVIEKVTEPVIEKVPEPIIEKVPEPVIEKVAEPIIEKVAEPVIGENTEIPKVEKVTKDSYSDDNEYFEITLNTDKLTVENTGNAEDWAEIVASLFAPKNKNELAIEKKLENINTLKPSPPLSSEPKIEAEIPKRVKSVSSPEKAMLSQEELFRLAALGRKSKEEKEKKTVKKVSENDIYEEKVAISEPIVENIPEEKVAIDEPIIENIPEEKNVIDEPIVENKPEGKVVIDEPIIENKLEEKVAIVEPIVENIPEEKAVIDEPIVEIAPEEKVAIDEPIVENISEEKIVIDEPIVENKLEEKAAIDEPIIENIPEKKVASNEPIQVLKKTIEQSAIVNIFDDEILQNFSKITSGVLKDFSKPTVEILQDFSKPTVEISQDFSKLEDEIQKDFSKSEDEISKDFSKPTVEISQDFSKPEDEFSQDFSKKSAQINFSTPTADLPLDFAIPNIKGNSTHYSPPPQPVFTPPAHTTMRDANGNLLIPTTNEYGQIIYVAAAPSAPVYVQPTYVAPQGYPQYPGVAAYSHTAYGAAHSTTTTQRPAPPPRSFSVPPPLKTSFAQKSPPLPPRTPKPPVPKPIRPETLFPKIDVDTKQETLITQPSIIDFDNMDKIGIRIDGKYEDDIQIDGFKKYDPNAVKSENKKEDNKPKSDDTPKELDKIDRAFQKKMAKMEAEKEKETKKKK
jgi:hypothetical protein